TGIWIQNISWKSDAARRSRKSGNHERPTGGTGRAPQEPSSGIAAQSTFGTKISSPARWHGQTTSPRRHLAVVEGSRGGPKKSCGFDLKLARNKRLSGPVPQRSCLTFRRTSR